MRTVGRYTLERLLGRGTAEVFLAWDPEIQSQVALKLVPLTAAREILEGERRGAELQKEIRQKEAAVAGVLDVGQADGFFYVTMEYVSGPPLSRLLEERRTLEPYVSVSVAEQLCRVLETFHGAAGELSGQKGPLVHGDLKPENVRVEGRWRVRLLDFGLARRLDGPDASASSEYGSMPYASPERLRDAILSPAADLWSVGVMLYEMVAGRLPFPGETDDAIRCRILESTAPEPLAAGQAQELQSLLRRALDPDPVRRYPDATSFRRALEGLPVHRPQDVGKTRRVVPGRKHAGEPRRPPGAEPAGPRTPTPGAGRPESGRRRVDPARRRRRLRMLVVLVAAILVVPLALQIYAISAMADVQDALASPDPPLPPLVEEYLRIRRVDLLGLVAPVGRELEARLVAVAEATVQAHRGGRMVAREEWKVAAEAMELAQEIGGTQDREMAWEAYCLAHLAHRSALDHLARGERTRALEDWADAVSGFRTAADAAADSGVPYLGLAAVYLTDGYGTVDPDELAKALRIGERREDGRLSRAEHELLMQGHRRLGEIAEARAVELAGRREKGEMLRDARTQFEDALVHCEAVAEGVTGDCLRERTQDLERVRRRLEALGYLSSQPRVKAP